MIYGTDLKEAFRILADAIKYAADRYYAAHKGDN